MFYLGMDVAKAKLDCCLLLGEASGKRKTKVVKMLKNVAHLFSATLRMLGSWISDG